MNDQIYHCDLPEGHKGLHENGTNAWTGWAYHTAEPELTTMKHIQYHQAYPTPGPEEKNEEIQPHRS